MSNKTGNSYYSEHATYWILLNGKQYIGLDTFAEAQYVMQFFRACGCKDKLEIEADYKGD